MAGALQTYTQSGVTHPGLYGTVNGRNASNSLDLHAVKVGLNYRF